jgi:hypothetical protein
VSAAAIREEFSHNKIRVEFPEGVPNLGRATTSKSPTRQRSCARVMGRGGLAN